MPKSIGEVLSSWATKVSEIGQQALLGAKGVAESQGVKGLGSHRPWVFKSFAKGQADLSSPI